MMNLECKSQYSGMFRQLFTIAQLEGYGRTGLLKGIEGTVLREASFSSLRLGMYEPIKRMMGADDPSNTKVWVRYASGGLSGIIAAAIANPADILKVRM